MKKISPKQIEILGFIDEFITDKGYPPTVREIGRGVGFSSSASVHSQLNKLEGKGLIKRDAITSRGITLVKQDKNNFINIPMVGLVTAGNPIEAIEDVTQFFPIPTHLVKSNDIIFALEVAGTSMKNAGILDKDTIIVRKSDVASNGEIIIAMTEDNEVTVKRFYKEKDYFRLQPENDDFDPIILKDVKIIGKVIGVFRDLS